MSKFKVGDRVIIVVDDVHKSLVGASGIVTDNAAVSYILLDDQSIHPFNATYPIWACHERDLELEAVYNSPLFQALL